MTRCYLLHQPFRSGGTREATRADKKNAEKIAPLPAQARVRRWEGRLEPFLGGQGAGLAISEPPAILREITRAGLRASCDEDARPRLSSWKRPATGRGKWAAAGAGMENPCEKQKNMRRVKSGWKKSPSQCMQKHNPNDLWRVEKYHRVITTFPPRYHRTRRRTGPPTSWAARNRRPAHQKCAPRRLGLLQEPPVNRDISPLVPILVRKSNSLSPLSRLHGRRATPWPRRHRAILRPRKKTKKFDPKITLISLWGCASVIQVPEYLSREGRWI